MTGKIYCNTMQWLVLFIDSTIYLFRCCTFRTCYLFITTEFNGSFHWLEVRRISQVPDESRHEKTLVFAYAKNKDADQPANPCSLIIVFVNRCLDRTIYIRNSKPLARILRGANQSEFCLAEKTRRQVFSLR